MNTKYAPAERKSREEVLRQFKTIKSIDYIDQIFNSLPYMAMVLNADRQIVFSNDILLKLLDIPSVSNTLWKRPGELFKCIHAEEEEGGCGTSEHCKVCGAVNSILKCQQSNEKTSEECRITAELDGEEVAFDFMTIVNQFKYKKEAFYIFSLTDISNTKRKQVLERIFFHDVINKVGSLKGFMELLNKTDDIEKLKKYISLASRISNELTEEILAQRQLVAAENNDLSVNPVPVSSRGILESVTHQITSHEVAKGRKFNIDKDATDIDFNVDHVLLNRILINMLKNAFEATPEGGEVTVSCEKKNANVVFWVHNESVMPPHVQLQIFKRSFSTKGANRGIGTYSIKLLTERYLKGEVNFESDEKRGTTFFVKLPL